MAKVFVLQGHPNSNSFTRALGREFIRGLKDANHEVLDLHAYDTDLPLFDPTRIDNHGQTTYAEMKNFVPQASALVFVFPVWWGGPPAALKNVIDHCDFAFSAADRGLTTGLRATSAYCILTSDAPAGWSKATVDTALRGVQEPFKQLGVKKWGLFHVPNMRTGTLEQRKGYLGRAFTESQKFARSLG